jgi:hypothetical protein
VCDSSCAPPERVAVTGAVPAAIDDIEQRWRSEIGDTDWNRLRSTLARMHRPLLQSGATGPALDFGSL